MTTLPPPSMQIEDISLRTRPSFLRFMTDPMRCHHRWEPHLLEDGRAYCARCGSQARWVNDPRLAEASAS